MTQDQTQAADRDWLRLMLSAGDIGPGRLGELLGAFDDARGVFAAGRRACAGIVGDEPSRRLFSDERLEEADRILAWAAETPQAAYLTWADADFPKEVLAFSPAPSVFLLRGRRELLSFPRAAVIGADRPDSEGLANAAFLSSGLVRSGTAVVSLAVGETDEAVCRAALDASDGERAAGLIVLSATGPDRLWPPAMREVYHRAAAEGLVMTPFAPASPVSDASLAERRAVCACLCHKLLVVQAELPSEAHDLARLFADHNRDVYAVPGSIRNPLYKGCHKLLREGTRLTEAAADLSGL